MDKDRWQKKEFVGRYLEYAGIYIPERERFYSILASLFNHFIAATRGAAMLDLGSGDGILTELLLGLDPELRATLVDSSPEMIKAAKKRLSGFKDVEFLELGFDEFIGKRPELPGFDLAYSSLALHHLTPARRSELFAYVYSILKPGAFFVNMDLVRPASGDFSDWYQEIRKEQTGRMEEQRGLKGAFDEFLEMESDPEHHQGLGTLDNELGALKDAGFSQVDCVYKDGLFAVCAARK